MSKSDRIEEAFVHLAGALMQAIDSDDQIIVGHMRDAHDLLRAELRERGRLPGSLNTNGDLKMSDFTSAPWEVADGIVVCRGGSDTGPGPILFVLRAPMGTSKPYPHELLAEHADTIVKAVNNHQALLEFFKWAMREGPWDGGDLDGGSVQDKAEALGLIVKTQYDAEKHGVQSEFEHGDDWFEYAPDIRAPLIAPRHT